MAISMNSTPEALHHLSQCFLHSLSPDPTLRQQAESQLTQLSQKPNYSLSLLGLISTSSIDQQIRLSASISFKNLIKSRWAAERITVFERAGLHRTRWVSKEVPKHNNELDPQEKENIKKVIVSVTVIACCKVKVRKQLCEAVSVIGKHEFPQSWANVLPELVIYLAKFAETNDYVSVVGVLEIANALFKMFRERCHSYTSERMYSYLLFCVEKFGGLLLDVFKRTAGFLDECLRTRVGGFDDLKAGFEVQRLCCRIFYSLNALACTKFFEQSLGEWMGEFRKYLTVTYSDLEEGVALVDQLRVAVCKNLTLLVRVDGFQGYVGEFVETVWGLLIATSGSVAREKLTIAAIKFLTAVSTCVKYELFARDDILQQICQGIVVPNVMLRDDDEELFEINYVEFMRRDMQGSDNETRRRTPCELLKGIGLSFKDKVKEKVVAQVESLLASFQANPVANWKHKDCAIYLVVALAKEDSCDYTRTTDLVDVDRFFLSVIVPELQNGDVNGFPILKSAALKFFTVFRRHISKHVAMALLPDVVRFVGSKSNTVHTYAATCIEGHLCVRDGGVPRYSAAEVAPFLRALLTNLFSALQIPESEENYYVMDCIKRVLRVANVPQELSLPCMDALATVMYRVCQNPNNHIFNRHVFESVELLIERSCEQDPRLISAFEERIFPILEMIFSRDLKDSFSHVFKLLARLVDFNITSPLPGSYMQIFDAILVLPDEPWKLSARRSEFVYWLQALLRKAPRELNQHGKLPCVVGICTDFVSSIYSELHGFNVLKTVIENLEYDVISAYISQIWVALFKRLETDNRNTESFYKSLIMFMSLFVVKHGSQNLAASMNAVQPDISRKILEDIWIPNLKLIKYSMELKLTSVALTRVMCESLSPSDSNLWGKMLDGIATLVSKIKSLKVEDRVEEVPDFGETVGYSDSTFVKLYNAWRKEDDPLREMHDPEQYLVASLAKLSGLSLQ